MHQPLQQCLKECVMATLAHTNRWATCISLVQLVSQNSHLLSVNKQRRIAAIIGFKGAILSVLFD